MVDTAVARLDVLGRFAFDGPDGPIRVSPIGQRLLAALAVHGGSVPRHRLTRMLWPTSREERGEANLRSTAWRLPGFIRERLVVAQSVMALPASWGLDVNDARRTVECIRRRDLARVDTSLLADDVLPDWDEEWLFAVRESHRQLRLHALEELARQHLRSDRCFQALDAAMQALASEPLRESAQQLVLSAHLAAGNRSEVRRLFDEFADLLASELAVTPSPAMCALVEQAGRTVTLS